jgi:alkylation response protein AidB-like acyl-CoA dehydrogenase
MSMIFQTVTSRHDTETQADYEALAAVFRPHFNAIAEGVVERERQRQLPYAEVAALLKAGFGALRIPKRHGGSGASLSQLFQLLIELGEADSNIVQIFRAHFGFVEGLLHGQEPALQATWFERIAGGAMIGAAMSEQVAVGNITMQLVRRDGDWILNGEKYYSTGTLYADWMHILVTQGDDFVLLALPVKTPGVTLVDDWDGFGQRMTGSGTTRFDNVVVTDDLILRRVTPEKFITDDTYILAFYQQMHLAALAGIGRAVLRDAVSYVRAKTRVFFVPGISKPQEDPLVQRVVGRLSSLSFTLDSIVESVSAKLDAAWQKRRLGDSGYDDPAYVAADLAVFHGQQIAIDLVHQAATQLFEVGGASALSEKRQLDRHWQNARTISSHNPAIMREQVLGNYRLNGVSPRAVQGNSLSGKSDAMKQA